MMESGNLGVGLYNREYILAAAIRRALTSKRKSDLFTAAFGFL